jgi:putative acetyltransferase
MVTIRPETYADAAAVRRVHTEAFADEPVVADLLAPLRARAAPLPATGLVAQDGDDIVGHVLLSHAWLDAPRRLVDVLVLSPLGVLPAAQGRGAGSALVRAAVAELDRIGAPALFLEGDPAYYSRLGFRAAGPLGFRAPSLRIPDAAFQVVLGTAYEPWMTGTLVYPDVFWAYDAVGLRDPDA